MRKFIFDKSDLVERERNRQCSRALRLLDDLIEHIGVGEEFDFEDVKSLRSVRGRKGMRSYYSKSDIEWLVDKGFVDSLGDKYVVDSVSLYGRE